MEPFLIAMRRQMSIMHPVSQWGWLDVMLRGSRGPAEDCSLLSGTAGGVYARPPSGRGFHKRVSYCCLPPRMDCYPPCPHK